MELYVESGEGGGLPSIILDPKAFSRWREGEPISSAQQAQMFRNFEEAMAFQCLKMIVEKGE